MRVTVTEFIYLVEHLRYIVTIRYVYLLSRQSSKVPLRIERMTLQGYDFDIKYVKSE